MLRGFTYNVNILISSKATNDTHLRTNAGNLAKYVLHDMVKMQIFDNSFTFHIHLLKLATGQSSVQYLNRPSTFLNNEVSKELSNANYSQI